MGVLDDKDDYSEPLHLQAYDEASSRIADIDICESEELKPYIYFEVLRQLGEIMLRDFGFKSTREFWIDCFKEAVQGDWR